MTNLELITKLNQLPLNAEVVIWDVERDIPTDRIALQYDEKHNNLVLTTEGGRSRPFGKSKFRPAPQQLTNRKFMSKHQRLAFDKGEEIWV